MPEKKNSKQEKEVKQEAAKPEEAVSGQQAAENTPAAVIYLGPPIAGVAMPGTVYKNGLTPQLKAAVKEVPALNRLLVATKNAQQVRKDLKDPQSAAGICYQSVLDYARQKGAKG